jgi:hypothetical protein
VNADSPSTPALLPWVIGASLVVMGALLRLPGLFTDLALDEIWSLSYASTLASPLGVFTEVHHDSNHWLNTLFLYALGERPGWVYRLPAYFAGSLAIAMAWRATCALLRRDDALLEPALGAGFVAVAFPLVFYGSEARGYGTLILFTLVALDMLLRYAQERRKIFKVGYWVATILGFLSHLVFVHLFAGAVLWALVALRRDDEGKLPDDLLRMNWVPMAFLGLLFAIDLRLLTFGGGPDYSLHEVVAQAASLALGGPHDGPLAFGAAALAALALFGALALLRKDADDRWILLGVTAVLFPALITVTTQPAFLFPRYYLVGMIVFQLALALGLGRMLRAEKPWLKALAALAIPLVVLGHGVNLVSFWERGRGHYREAIVFVAANSPTDLVRVSGDHHFRTKTLVDHYQRFVSNRAITYVEDPGPRGVEWWIAHSLAADHTPETTVNDDAGNAYQLERSYPSGRLSGFRWFVYRRK